MHMSWDTLALKTPPQLDRYLDYFSHKKDKVKGDENKTALTQMLSGHLHW